MIFVANRLKDFVTHLVLSHKYVENLEPLYDIGAEIGGYLAERCVSILQVKPEEIQSYGKRVCTLGRKSGLALIQSRTTTNKPNALKPATMPHSKPIP